LNTTNYGLVSTVVTGTVGAALASDLKQFFDGTTPKGSTNFTDPSNMNRYNTLALHLIEFFGAALGCTDGTILAYGGNPNMKAVHANMPITPHFFNEFNQALIGVLAGAGVTPDDQDAVLAVLESTKADICNTDCAAMTSTSTTGDSAAVSTVASATLVVVAVAALL
jgi:hypothetical protein